MFTKSQLDLLKLQSANTEVTTDLHSALSKLKEGKEYGLDADEKTAILSVLSCSWPTALDAERNEIVRFLTEPTEAEKWEAVRYERSKLLSESDWAMLPDAPITVEEKTAITTYRQSLRNITESKPTPEEVVMPAVNVEKLSKG